MFWCCGVVMCCVGAGVGVQYVVLVLVCNVWCVVSVVCVWCGLARGKPSVCRFKTSPCVGSKRLRVYRQNARMLNTCARFCRYTQRRFEPTHGDVWNLHTGASLSLSPRSLTLLSSLSSSLSATMTMITRPFGSLCVHTALTCESVRVRGRGPFLVGRTCSHHARNYCPGITVQTSCHLE